MGGCGSCGSMAINQRTEGCPVARKNPLNQCFFVIVSYLLCIVVVLTRKKVAVGVNSLTYFDMRGRAEAARLMLYELAVVCDLDQRELMVAAGESQRVSEQ
jgi:hypothetical protein